MTETAVCASPIAGTHASSGACCPAAISGRVRFAPDSNRVCLALNPRGNRDLARMNAFVRDLHDELRCDPTHPLQLKEFFGSMTTLRPEVLGLSETTRILQALGIQ